MENKYLFYDEFQKLLYLGCRGNEKIFSSLAETLKPFYGFIINGQYALSPRAKINEQKTKEVIEKIIFPEKVKKLSFVALNDYSSPINYGISFGKIIRASVFDKYSQRLWQDVFLKVSVGFLEMYNYALYEFFEKKLLASFLTMYFLNTQEKMNANQEKTITNHLANIVQDTINSTISTYIMSEYTEKQELITLLKGVTGLFTQCIPIGAKNGEWTILIGN